MRARKDLVKHRIALANQLRANVLAALPGAVGLFAEIDSPISLTFLTRLPSQLVAALRELRARIDAIDEAIAETLALHHDAAVFTSLPRVGTNRAALLLADIGDCLACFPDDAALAAAAGVAPSTGASGKRHHVAFRHSCDKSCAKHPSTSPPTAAKPVLGPPGLPTSP